MSQQGASAKTVSAKTVALTLAVIGGVSLVLAIGLVRWLEHEGPAALNFLNDSTEVLGKPAPAIELPSLTSSGTVSLTRSRGQPALVELTSTWCPACQEQTRVLSDLAAERSGLPIVTLLFREDPLPGRGPRTPEEIEAGVRQWVKAEGIRRPVALAPPKVVEAYGASRMPTLYLIDAEGVIRYTAAGLHSPEVLRRVLSEHGANP